MKHERDIRAIPGHHEIFTRLTEIRLAWKLSLEDVAVRMECGTETLRKYELGVKMPSLSALLRWADALGYTLTIWPKEQK